MITRLNSFCGNKLSFVGTRIIFTSDVYELIIISLSKGLNPLLSILRLSFTFILGLNTSTSPELILSFASDNLKKSLFLNLSNSPNIKSSKIPFR